MITAHAVAESKWLREASGDTAFMKIYGVVFAVVVTRVVMPAFMVAIPEISDGGDEVAESWRRIGAAANSNMSGLTTTRAPPKATVDSIVDGESSDGERGEDELDLRQLHAILGGPLASKSVQRPLRPSEPDPLRSAPDDKAVANNDPTDENAEWAIVAQGMSPDQLQPYLQMLTLERLEKMSKKKNHSSSDDSSDASDYKPKRGIAAAYDRMRR